MSKKHIVKITTSCKKTGATLETESQSFFNSYNAERLINEIDEKYFEKNRKTHPFDKVVKAELIRVEQQWRAA